ncbi:putative bifunctional diguanylate cyclase/phosphodiesterase [Paenibacillus sp. MMS18-CY102]|uniref:putative bifunctional diguanylate cyclase/phosphodiesterase n=1 Tax=Paenibacillus sp. MMS18-CY102 TaxID=2682849 RepID=UPI0013665569|nr:EAL domain-containing protein [Paenibacillus sp. MMS18-CY102]
MTNLLPTVRISRLIIVFILVGLAAYFSYAYPVELFFGIGFSCGAALILLTSQLLGWRAGLLMLVLVHGAILCFMPPSSAFLLHTGELVIAMALVSRWPRLGLIGASALYWLCIGIPMQLFIQFDAGRPTQETLFFTYAVMASGLGNALVAEFAAVYGRAGMLFGHAKQGQVVTLRISRALLHLTLAAMLGSSMLFFISGGHTFKQNMMRDLSRQASQSALTLELGFKAMSKAERRGLRLNGYLERAAAHNLIRNVLSSAPYEAILTSHDGRQLLNVSNGTAPMKQWHSLIARQEYGSLHGQTWSPEPSRPELAGAQWTKMSYIYSVYMDGFILHVRLPLDTYRNEMYGVYAAQLVSSLYISVIFGLFALFIHRFLVRAVHRLALVSGGIPDKVKEGVAPMWPQSKLEEINWLVGNFRVVTEKLSSMFMESREQAYYDSLTGLPNRLHFNEHLQNAVGQAKRQGQEVYVMFVDLDRFKHINDTLGHTVGDLLLEQVAVRLSRDLDPHMFMARLGGDEFVLVLIAEEEKARTLAIELLADLENPFHIGGEELYVTASIGIGSSAISGYEAETIVKNADFAMYDSKAIGGNGYCFFTPPTTDLSHRMRLEFELRKAVDRQQLMLHYMPIYDRESERVISLEALLRWTHPEQGLVSPGLFIPMAESCGLLKPIGEWVAREACRQIKEWQNNGEAAVPVAINLSPTQIQLYGIVDYLEQLLTETGIPPELLEVEITEEVFAKHPERVIAELHRLKQRGVKVWIDDFGTGYSSLGLLNRMPVDGFKIDRTFVHGLEEDTDKLSIIHTMMLLAQARNWLVVAEGVETNGEAAALKAAGCCLQQGYYYSKALPAQKVSKWFGREGR